MNQFTKRLFIAALVTIVLPLSAAQAKPFGFGPTSGHGGGGPQEKAAMMEPGPRIMSDLDLSDRQIDLLKKRKLEKHKTMIGLRSELQTLRVDLAEEASRAQPDMARINALSRKVGTIQGKMTTERMESIVYLRSILNDKQKKIMDTHHLEFGARHCRKHGSRRSNGFRQPCRLHPVLRKRFPADACK